MSSGDYKSLFDVLDAIERRPSMFLGADPDTREIQLDRLEMLIVGYELALGVHRIAEPGGDFFRKFAEFVRESYGLDTTCGPIAAIKLNSATGEDAWRTLWTALRRYKDRCTETSS